VSLIVTAAIALILALAVTCPAFRRRRQWSGGRTLIVIDSSVDGARTASGGSRWDALEGGQGFAEAPTTRSLATTADGLARPT
jgi:hypothetical protein